jgi:hypothetical protein
MSVTRQRFGSGHGVLGVLYDGTEDNHEQPRLGYEFRPLPQAQTRTEPCTVRADVSARQLGASCKQRIASQGTEGPQLQATHASALQATALQYGESRSHGWKRGGGDICLRHTFALHCSTSSTGALDAQYLRSLKYGGARGEHHKKCLGSRGLLLPSCASADKPTPAFLVDTGVDTYFTTQFRLHLIDRATGHLDQRFPCFALA